MNTSNTPREPAEERNVRGMENRRRIVTDPNEVLASVASTVGQDLDRVTEIIGVFREAIDGLLATGAIVVTGELFLSFGDSPTRRGLLERLRSGEDIPEQVLRGDPAAVAKWIELPRHIYDEHPLANRPHVMREVVDLCGDTRYDHDGLWDVLEAWDQTFADGRRYKVSSAGLEAAAELWLIEHLPRLRLHGFPVDLAHQQMILPSGRRPDLLCRLNDSVDGMAAGDWLVVELKATRFYWEAAEQVLSYAVEVSQVLADGQAVHTLLITDGADHTDIEELREKGIGHLSLATLGYRAHLAQERIAASPSTTAPVLSEEPPAEAQVIEDFDGPEAYWVRLFWDQEGDEDQERKVAHELWAARERRREQYRREWGPPSKWPATHPTTVLGLKGIPGDAAAVCIACDWVARIADLSPSEGLQHAARDHALAHTHHPLLEQGVNPPRPARPPRRRARRVDPRPPGTNGTA